jgi:hypothetical protein
LVSHVYRLYALSTGSAAAITQSSCIMPRMVVDPTSLYSETGRPGIYEETGREPLPKDASFYGRSPGRPFSRTPSWADLAQLPPSRRDIVARPDLALDAMRRILSRRENELARDADAQERRRLQRLERLDLLQQRHGQRHEEQRKIGVVHKEHSYALRLEQRRRMRDIQTCNESSHDSQDSPQRPDSPERGHSDGALLSPGSAGVSASDGRTAGLERTLSAEALNLRGMEGLLLPRNAGQPTGFLSPSSRTGSAHSLLGSRPFSAHPLSPSRTPAPLASPPRSGRSSPSMPVVPTSESTVAHDSRGAIGSMSNAHTTGGVPMASYLIHLRNQSAAAAAEERIAPPDAVSDASRAEAAKAARTHQTATLRVGSRDRRTPLLGWVEPYGQSLGRAPRRLHFHFEGGLAR